MSWVMGEMCCTTYNHVAAPNTRTCAGSPFPAPMSNMAMQVPPSSAHANGVNLLLCDGSTRFVTNGINLTTWRALGTPRGLFAIVGGGFLVGFGTAYAGGCTSGHGISGVANLEVPSFIALAAFFAGGLIGTFLLMPLVFGGLR